MIAIPLNDKNATTISDLYGNAPHFALLDTVTGSFKVEANKGCGNGVETAKCVKEMGATSTIFYHMGEAIFDFFDNNEVKVYCASKVFLTIEEIYRKVLKNNCKLITAANAETFLDPGTSSCSCECSK